MAARAFVWATLVVGCVTFAVAAVKATTAQPTALALLAAAVIVAELIEVAQPARSLDPPPGNFSFSSGIHMGAVLLVGPWPAALIAGAGVVVSDTLRGSAWRKIGFNATVFALASLIGGFAFQALGGAPGAVRLPDDLPALVALLAAYTTVNAVLVSMAISLHAGVALPAVLRSALRPAVSCAEGAIGVSLALLAEDNPWDVLALVPLLVVAYQALARLALLRSETARALEAFANVVDERDPYTFRHSDRVAGYVRSLATALGLPSSQISRLAWAGRLHDVGKIAVDASILRKPGRLDAEEWEAIRRHPRLSARLLRHFRLAWREARAVEYHHERFDGQGYYGIPPEEVPMAAHFLTVADTFDAMTSDRPYRPGLPEEEALAEIERGAGTQFHPLVAKAFVALRRGHDPRAVLSRDERRALRRALASRRRLGSFSVRLPYRQAAALSSAVAGLLLLGFGERDLGLGLTAGAAAAAAVVRAEAWRGHRLGRRIRETIEGSPELGEALDRVANAIASRGRVRWAGVVRWEEQTLDGAVLREWGWRSARPDPAALTSWLIRDAELSDELLVCPGADLGRQGTYAAVPLASADRHAVVGFLVLGFAGRIPPHVQIALRGCLDIVTETLTPRRLSPVLAAPAPPAAHAGAEAP